MFCAGLGLARRLGWCFRRWPECGFGGQVVFEQLADCVDGRDFFVNDLATVGAFLAGAAAGELFDGAEGVAEGALVRGFVAQDELLLLVKNSQLFIGESGLAEGDLGVEEGGDGAAEHAVGFDERREERLDGRAVEIEFGFPRRADGVHFGLRFSGEKFPRIGTESVLGGVLTGARFSVWGVRAGIVRLLFAHFHDDCEMRRAGA